MMVQPGHIVRVLVASPSDVRDERVAIQQVIANWNAAHSYDRAIIIEPVLWESHAVPLQGDRPQETINKQLGGRCDFLIAVFWNRIGTDTGVAVSGTAEEIKEFLAAGKDVLIYKSNCPVQPNSLELKQLEKLDAFKKDIRGKGLQFEYTDINKFREKLNNDLT